MFGEHVRMFSTFSGGPVYDERGFCANVQDFELGFMLNSSTVPSCTADKLHNTALDNDDLVDLELVAADGQWRFSSDRLPDLTVEVSHSPLNPTTEDAITFMAVVKYAGQDTANPSTLNVRVGGETYGNNYVVPMLAPGESYAIRHQATLSVAQNYLTTVTADADDEVTRIG